MPRRDPASKDSFDDLLRLLAVKRHEAPPPGYFSGFSDKVLARIEAGETLEPTSWWNRLRTALVTQPSLAAALGVLVVVACLTPLGLGQSGGAVGSNADFFLSGAPTVVQAAMVEWPRDVPVQAVFSRDVSALGSGSVAPLIAGRTEAMAGLVHAASYPSRF